MTKFNFPVMQPPISASCLNLFVHKKLIYCRQAVRGLVLLSILVSR